MVVLYAMRAKPDRAPGLEPEEPVVFQSHHPVLKMDLSPAQQAIRDDVRAVGQRDQGLGRDSRRKKACIPVASGRRYREQSILQRGREMEGVLIVWLFELKTNPGLEVNQVCGVVKKLHHYIR